MGSVFLNLGNRLLPRVQGAAPLYRFFLFLRYGVASGGWCSLGTEAKNQGRSSAGEAPGAAMPHRSDRVFGMSSAIEGGDLALGGMIGDPLADAAQLFEQLLKLLPLVADLAGNGLQPGQILVAQLLVQALLQVMLEALAQDLPMQGEEQMQEQMQSDEH